MVRYIALIALLQIVPLLQAAPETAKDTTAETTQQSATKNTAVHRQALNAFASHKLGPQALDKYREKGLYKGWRLFFDNQVDTNNKATTRAKANTYIATQIQTLIGAKESSAIDKPLRNLANYLNLLFVELDLGEAPVITEYQRDILFNLAFDLQDKRIDSKGLLIPFADLQVDLKPLEKAITQFYRKHDDCQVAVSVKPSAEGQNIAAISVYVEKDQESIHCSNRPEQFNFNNETLWVNKLTLTGDTEMPHMGVSLTDIQELLETERQEKTGYMINGLEGFSQPDLITLADHISHIYYLSAGGMNGHKALDELPKHIMKLREGRGLTFEQLEAISDTLTGYYRSKGLILATVYIPVQDFQYAYGDIKLALLKGILGSVEVRGIDELHYDKRIIVQAFDTHIGKEVTDAVSDGYFLVNNLPGLSVESGLFEVGENPGETKLVLDVKEKNIVFSASVDNYGTRLTGKNRFMITGGWLNPSGIGDVVSMGYLRTGNPSNANLGFINYSLPILDARTSLLLAFDTNLYEANKRFAESGNSNTGTTQVVNDTNADNTTSDESTAGSGQDGLDTLTEGQSYTFMAGLNRKLEASKDFNVDAGVHLSYKKSVITTTFITTNGQSNQNKPDNEDSIGLELTSHLDFLSSPLRSVFSLDTTLATGHVDIKDKTKKDYSYAKLHFSMKTNSLIAFSKRIRTKLGSTIKMTYSGSKLPSIEQFQLGGPYAVKAFPSSTFIGDTGALISIKWTLDVFNLLPFESLNRNHSFDLGVFYEEAYGSLKALDKDEGRDSWANLSGYGFTARYGWRKSLIIDSSLSRPYKARKGGPVELFDVTDDNQILLSLKYLFN